MTIVSEIKLIRTDTTLDLSQKAEKVCFFGRLAFSYIPCRVHSPVTGRPQNDLGRICPSRKKGDRKKNGLHQGGWRLILSLR